MSEKVIFKRKNFKDFSIFFVGSYTQNSTSNPILIFSTSLKLHADIFRCPTKYIQTFSNIIPHRVPLSTLNYRIRTRIRRFIREVRSIKSRQRRTYTGKFTQFGTRTIDSKERRVFNKKITTFVVFQLYIVYATKKIFYQFVQRHFSYFSDKYRLQEFTINFSKLVKQYGIISTHNKWSQMGEKQRNSSVKESWK